MKNLTKEDIRVIFNLNVMSGKIETGQRYWICGWLSLPYRHKLESKIRFVRELTESVDNCSCYPIEKTRQELSKQIERIVDRLFVHYQNENRL